MRLESISKVETVYQALEERIRTGAWKIGDCLPTEAELSVEFDCGRNTISKAVTRLVHEGLVERKKRAGTRVLRAVSDRGHAAVELDAVAFICPSDQHEGIWRTMRGFQLASREAGQRMLMLTTGLDYRKELEVIGRMAEFDVLGVALSVVGPPFEDLPSFSKRLNNSPVPIMLAGVGLPGLQLSSVIVDGFHASYTMTHHLIERGVRKIGFFDIRTLTPSMSMRYQGYRWALTEAGLREDERFVCMRDSKSVDFDHPLIEPTVFGRDYLDQVKGLGVEGVVCGMDFWALGLIAAATERGIQVPKDLKVTGMDDYAIASTAPVPLTTYQVPFEKIGKLSFEMLEDLIANRMPRSVERQVRGELVIRKSA